MASNKNDAKKIMVMELSFVSFLMKIYRTEGKLSPISVD